MTQKIDTSTEPKELTLNVLLVLNARFLTLHKGTQQQAARETICGLEEWAIMFRAAGLDVEERYPSDENPISLQALLHQ